MREKLEKLIENAYSPYYHYRVASIVVTNDGKEFSGVNVENASPASGTCAERNAIYSAITGGYKKGDFKAIYLMVEDEKIAFPCFVCRQTISEFFDLNADLYLYTKGGLEESKKMNDIIQYPFDLENLS